MAETSKPSRRRRSAAPVNRRTTSVTWGKHASGFDGSFKRTKYGYPSASARLAMQAESSLWGRKRVVGSKLKHDGTLGYISRGAARRSGLNPAGWHRYVPIAVVVAVIVIALAALGYAGGGANLDAVFKSPELAHAGTEVVEGAQTQTGVAPQRGIVAAASTIADAQKDEDKQGADADANQTSETAITPSAGLAAGQAQVCHPGGEMGGGGRRRLSLFHNFQRRRTPQC